MTITRVRLVDPAAGRELLLGGRDNTRRDMLLHTINAGDPTTRQVSEDRAMASGAIDSTRLHGPRAVSAEITLLGKPNALIDELQYYLHPSVRPWLGVLDDEWDYPGERRLRLRKDSFDPGLLNHRSHQRRGLQLQWVCPSGVWEAVDPLTATLLAASDEQEGRTYPLQYPVRTYPPTTGAGVSSVDNPGRTWSDQRVYLYGPCNGPRYSNADTGETITFLESCVVNEGDYIEVDTLAHTALYNSDPAASRAHLIDYTVSSYWLMPPGRTQIRYHPVSGVEAGCQAMTTFSPCWLYE